MDNELAADDRDKDALRYSTVPPVTSHKPHKAARPELSPADVRRLVAHSGRAGGESPLKAKRGKTVFRVRLDNSSSAILKLWQRSGWRGWFRRASRTSAPDRELRVLRHLSLAGVRVPRVLGSTRLSPRESPFDFAIALEDMGGMGEGRQHMRRLLSAGDDVRLRAFEDALIDLTESILQARVVDPDHSLYNVTVSAEGDPTRLDFEIARIVRSPEAALRRCGGMLASLVASYAFTAQPDVGRVAAFANRLVERLQPPARALQKGRDRIERMLEHQRRTRGVDIRLDLRW